MEIKEIDIKSELYPRKLKEIDNPPKKLYIQGNVELLNKEALSIIGSRNSTEYGERTAKRFAKELSKQGIVIISGMAKGIDSCAHLGAIEGGGKTIAVLGSGFNYIFPDKEVYEKILESGGAIVTEYEKEVEVFPQGFRDRNRIVAGMSIATLVIEAKHKSGTSITAGYAKRYDRKLFCIPHTIEDEAGVGTNRLLKNGAILATSANDILPYYKNIKKVENKELIVEIPEEYRVVYEEIKLEPINVDEIRRIIKKPINEINTILTMLELEGFIESMPGNCFRRKEI